MRYLGNESKSKQEIHSCFTHKPILNIILYSNFSCTCVLTDIRHRSGIFHLHCVYTLKLQICKDFGSLKS